MEFECFIERNSIRVSYFLTVNDVTWISHRRKSSIDGLLWQNAHISHQTLIYRNTMLEYQNRKQSIQCRLRRFPAAPISSWHVLKNDSSLFEKDMQERQVLVAKGAKPKCPIILDLLAVMMLLRSSLLLGTTHLQRVTSTEARGHHKPKKKTEEYRCRRGQRSLQCRPKRKKALRSGLVVHGEMKYCILTNHLLRNLFHTQILPLTRLCCRDNCVW